MKYIKGSVRVVLSDPPCNDSNARFTMEPWKPAESNQ